MTSLREENESPGTTHFQAFRERRGDEEESGVGSGGGRVVEESHANTSKRILDDKKERIKEKRVKKSRTRTVSLPSQPSGENRVYKIKNKKKYKLCNSFA